MDKMAAGGREKREITFVCDRLGRHGGKKSLKSSIHGGND